MPRVVPPSQLRPPVVGLKGEQGSGKSTLGAALRRQAGSIADPTSDLEYSDDIIRAVNIAWRQGPCGVEEFGSRLRRAAGEVLGRTVPEPPLGWRWRTEVSARIELEMMAWLRLWPAEFVMTRENKALYRPFLSCLGVDIRELLGDDVWALQMARNLESRQGSSCRLVQIGGVRYPEDRLPIDRFGGVLLEVRSRRVKEDDDPTNARRHELIPHAVVHNDVPPERVDELAGVIWRDWCQGWLADEYGPASL